MSGYKYEKLNPTNKATNYVFYHDLAQLESSGEYANKERKYGNYLGAYQMGTMALEDVGYFKRGARYKNHDNYDEKLKGYWTGKNGVYCQDDFLNSPKIQDSAIRAYHQRVEKYLRANKIEINDYIGKEINGVTLTHGGIIAASHLVGHVRVAEYLKSNGTIDPPKDGNLVPCTDYMYFFADQRYNHTGIRDSIDISEDQAKLRTKYSQATEEKDVEIDKIYQYLDNLISQQEAEKANYIKKRVQEMQEELTEFTSKLSEELESKSNEAYSRHSIELEIMTQERFAAARSNPSAYGGMVTNSDLAAMKQAEYEKEIDDLRTQYNNKQKEKISNLTRIIQNEVNNIEQKNQDHIENQQAAIEEFLASLSMQQQQGSISIEMLGEEIDNFLDNLYTMG